MIDYLVQLEAYEGSMELLLKLIDKNKIDIYDIPIAKLTDQYIDYISNFDEFNLDTNSSFMIMAATLLHIKSKMLLPDADDEESLDSDPRLELVNRILEYKKYKEISKILHDINAYYINYVERLPLNIPTTKLPPDKVSINLLLKTFYRVNNIRDYAYVPEIIIRSDSYNIHDKMKLIMNIDNDVSIISFWGALPMSDKMEFITTFLALLELIHQKLIVVSQVDLYGDIYIEKKR